MMFLRIDMEPVAKGRPRMTRTGHAYTPAKTRKAEDLIASLATAYMQGGKALEEPINIVIRMTFKRPKSNKTEHHTQRPDADNCAKLVTDALNGVFYRDDSQIVALTVLKGWGSAGMIEVFAGPIGCKDYNEDQEDQMAKQIGAPPQGAKVPCSVEVGSNKQPTTQAQQSGKKGKK